MAVDASMAVDVKRGLDCELAVCKTLECQVQPDGWARGEREGYGEPCDVTSLSLSLSRICAL